MYGKTKMYFSLSLNEDAQVLMRVNEGGVLFINLLTQRHFEVSNEDILYRSK